MENLRFFTYKEAQVGIARIDHYSNFSFDDNQRFEKMFKLFKHDRRKNEWISSRILAEKVAHKNFDEIVYSAEGKPYCLDGSKISISHSRHFTAVIWHKTSEVGIDVDELRPQVFKIKEKFLSESEQKLILTGFSLETLTAFWCAKEALYKLYGLKQLQFNQHIQIRKAQLEVENGWLQGLLDTKVEKGDIVFNTQVAIMQVAEFMLAYAVADLSKGQNIG
ncbi:MAG: 4'-phosphopantetheinyl transferase superfamily protein [Sphingobacteriales bacterium]|nr:MAG: 4'-phosphopantetheinyl transferase superfamily protein [Sphingobacteriales bacterium]